MSRSYQISQSSDYPEIFEFTTDSNVKYRITQAAITKNYSFFNGYTNLERGLLIEMSISIISEHENPPLDYKIGYTLCEFIETYYTAYPDLVLFFLAENSDNKNKKRISKFKRWYETYCKDPKYTQSLEFHTFDFPMNGDFNGELGCAGYLINGNCILKHELNRWKIESIRSFNESKGAM